MCRRKPRRLRRRRERTPGCDIRIDIIGIRIRDGVADLPAHKPPRYRRTSSMQIPPARKSL
jgi:hypothetical protein